MADNIHNKDLYKILGVPFEATESDIKKAYRKKALQCHPDKNPDNPDAGRLFHELSLILEILTDESARAAYDKVLKAKQAAQIRHEQLDQQRKKLKEDLDARERQATHAANLSDEDRLKIEIERLRKEGSKALNEEREFMRQQMEFERQNPTENESSWDSSKHRIKIKWKADKNDPQNGGYNYDNLNRFLSKYGDIVGLVISKKKTGSAIVEFKTRDSAEMSVSIEKGLINNPLELDWVNGPPSINANAPSSGLVTDSDFESLVLRQMRQAEERKRLIEQMMMSDD